MSKIYSINNKKRPFIISIKVKKGHSNKEAGSMVIFYYLMISFFPTIRMIYSFFDFAHFFQLRQY